MTLISVDPTTEKTLRTYEELDVAAAVRIVDDAHQAFLDWKEKSFAERGEVLTRAARLLESKRVELAELMAREMGKPVSQGRAEAEKCAWVCDYSAERAATDLAPDVVATEARDSRIVFEPLGALLAIMPWNFPLWQVFRFAAPALMAGNVVVLKHASNVSGCALSIEDLLREAGFPEKVLTTLLVNSDTAGQLISHPRIAAITLTGSTAAGRAVASRAGHELKKTVLELGGSDPYVVLGDADVELAATLCVKSRLINAGQSCIAAKRFIVVESIRERFEELVVAAMSAARVGNPLEEQTEVGPLARGDVREELDRQTRQSIDLGARALLRGGPRAGPGYFFDPVVLADVRPGMPAFSEETFGPLAAIVPARDEREAIALANQSSYGLGAAVFTSDVERGARIATEELEAGCCFVNDFVRSDPRLPFGGIKESGYGRELGPYGAREFVNVKSIWVA